MMDSWTKRGLLEKSCIEAGCSLSISDCTGHFAYHLLHESRKCTTRNPEMFCKDSYTPEHRKDVTRADLAVTLEAGGEELSFFEAAKMSDLWPHSAQFLCTRTKPRNRKRVRVIIPRTAFIQ